MGDERLGRYTVLKHLASGGMADVLLARADGTGGFERHVVLKRIRAEHAKDKRFITMFLDEARLAANLHHQNIVQVYDIGQNAGEHFFAMEYIHGEDLRRLLSSVSKQRMNVPLGYVCAIVSAVASGLHYAHERKDSKGKPLNIVHRDVSPSNVLIGYDGAIKVVDFGIAKAAMRQQETRSGNLKGKVSYMSPEQCKGDDIDRRSDVWALGVLAYELATTTRLFKGENDYLQMEAIVNGKVPLPRLKRPDLPNELSAIIMKALSVDPAKRYQTADELRIAIEEFAIKHQVTTSTSAIAGFMNKMFGQRQEPWLEEDSLAHEIDAAVDGIDAEAPTAASRRSWSEMAAAQDDDGDDKTRSDAKRRRSGVMSPLALSDTIAPPINPRETRTSMNLAFEAQGSSPATRTGLPPFVRKNLVLLAAPAVVAAALIVWKLASKSEPAHPPVAAAQPAPVATPTPAPTPVVEEPKHEIPAIRVAGAAEPTLPPRVAGPAEPVTPAPPPTPTVKPTAPKAPPAPAHVAQPAASTKKPTPVAAPTPAAPTAPTPPPPQPQITQPAAPPPPPDPVIPSLSNATVSTIASDNARQLSKCEGTNELHGDVAVAFQIDANGKVVKSQLSSSIKNPKVAACILKAVQSWKFPKPPSGSAKGVYSINYQ